ncbi:tyrosine--tRNA ligase [Candidatus Falkowbacteria bacterium CG10_big_fil_rev_8_21_14_0_10_44_15]|uniref:Tyrosine--tRNA ligase n=1 Tax=Candidatus Falkowbacteria bacterium CG10_big_fil_rev_8_21_14_0_10_44_15 TaxID=1974569 RepID=A0A2H0UZ47_9BACT|nr:MAG: tyrosine--tRNA ligase [Candidatus Falkowbacteria bacterium CG10_big_fil_rev_8_21_14_0_10_44_15]
MTKITTDENLIEKFLTRGVERIYPSVDALRQKLMSGERLRVYQGFDPTGPYLHVGHAIGIRALRILQELGHEVIFLVGDYTAKVGDPDKDTTRAILSDAIIKKNMAGWKKQAAQLIDFTGKNPVRFERNYTWLSKLKPEDVIRLLSQMTLQQTLARSLFKKRLDEDEEIYLQELLYPLMQGYDSVAMKVDIEIGGADQTFNMLVGRDLCKSYLEKEKFVRTHKMMDAPDGRTMSKTKGNGINLGDSAEDMYGKAMSYPDSAIASGLELLTDISMAVIKEIGNSLTRGENPMQYKKMMAFEIVKTIKGKAAAQKAQAYFANTVQKKETPSEITNYELRITNINIVDLLVEVKLAASKSEARRLIEQGGIKVDGEVVKDVNKIIEITKDGVLIQRGKRQFVKIFAKK